MDDQSRDGKCLSHAGSLFFTEVGLRSQFSFHATCDLHA